jgi:hypothetical protein
MNTVATKKNPIRSPKAREWCETWGIADRVANAYSDRNGCWFNLPTKFPMALCYAGKGYAIIETQAEFDDLVKSGLIQIQTSGRAILIAERKGGITTLPNFVRV